MAVALKVCWMGNFLLDEIICTKNFDLCPLRIGWARSQCSVTQSEILYFLFPKLFSASLEIEMFKQLHGVLVSQEGGSIQREGSNLHRVMDQRIWPMRGQYSSHVISAGQSEASILCSWSMIIAQALTDIRVNPAKLIVFIQHINPIWVEFLEEFTNHSTAHSFFAKKLSLTSEENSPSITIIRLHYTIQYSRIS